jgi:hypothetical protein
MLCKAKNGAHIPVGFLFALVISCAMTGVIVPIPIITTTNVIAVTVRVLFINNIMLIKQLKRSLKF